MRYDVVIVGGGITGVFTLLDLSQRSLDVALFERNALASGTSGRFHGLLHSGARYAVKDPVSARECIQENRILSKIAPHVIKDTGGLFVAVTESDLEYQSIFESSLKKCGIPFEEKDVEEILKVEPYLNRAVKSVVWVPDKVVYAHDLIFSVALTAYNYGARVFTYKEVENFIFEDGRVVGVKVYDKFRDEVVNVYADVVVNTSGPWAAKLLKKAGIHIDILPTAGAMGVVPMKLCNHVLNRMRPPSDGDILVPYTDNTSIMGTTAIVIEDPDNFEVSDEDIELLIDEGSEMVPIIKKLGFKRVYASVRPLLKVEGEKAGREASRTFRIIGSESTGIDGLFTVVGGKLTTGRYVAEKLSDKVVEYLGFKAKCKTSETSLIDSYSDENVENLARDLVLDYKFIRRLLSTKGTVDEERFNPAYLLLYSYIYSEDVK